MRKCKYVFGIILIMIIFSLSSCMSLFIPSVIGTWEYKASDEDFLVKIIITEQKGEKFSGDLYQKMGEKELTLKITNGYINSDGWLDFSCSMLIYDQTSDETKNYGLYFSGNLVKDKMYLQVVERLDGAKQATDNMVFNKIYE
ncbi:hypothetical protein [Marinitoga lauensis]|uniref:hypothetical protein n=1 Tax=Marinitoga lauensis TaxID=2201189 RepID=UPI00101369BA|nr:hypothetical protein [Marinitoga lauensis]